MHAMHAEPFKLLSKHFVSQLVPEQCQIELEWSLLGFSTKYCGLEGAAEYFIVILLE